MNVDYRHHTVFVNHKGALMIEGYNSISSDECFCIVAKGHRYHKYGIADDSLLYCCKNAEVGDGDLVVAFDGDVPTIYLYREDSGTTSEHEERILRDRKQIHAKVLGSFNFYH